MLKSQLQTEIYLKLSQKFIMKLFFGKKPTSLSWQLRSQKCSVTELYVRLTFKCAPDIILYVTYTEENADFRQGLMPDIHSQKHGIKSIVTHGKSIKSFDF